MSKLKDTQCENCGDVLGQYDVSCEKCDNWAEMNLAIEDNEFDELVSKFGHDVAITMVYS